VHPEHTVVGPSPDNPQTVQVDPGNQKCQSKCSYLEFPKGTKVILQPGSRDSYTYSFKGGQASCNPDVPCEFELLSNTTVTVTFPTQGGG